MQVLEEAAREQVDTGRSRPQEPPVALVRIRVQVKNELQHLALNQGVIRKRKLWSKMGEQVLRAAANPRGTQDYAIGR